MTKPRPLIAALASLTLLAIPALADQGATPAAAPVTAPAAAAPVASPALWKLADADTTIYLFGTVHVLPKDVAWFSGPIATALASAQTLVTEVPMEDMQKPEVQQAFIAAAMLPEGKTLRAMLDSRQRASFEAALTKIGMPVEALDRFEPWFAGLTLATVPLLKAGYSPDAGVEAAVESKLPAGVKRDALETVAMQLKLFDEMPVDAQINYLVALAEDMDGTLPAVNAMVAAWAKGDSEGLAKLMNEELDDPILADRLLYARNRNWAQWLETRLATPGTVFVAVGAGHLAGANSVQDYLGKEGLTVTRVQ